MSEKNYDSDAQCVSTPKRTIPITELPLAPTIRRDNSYQAGETGHMSGQLQQSVFKEVGSEANRQHRRHEEANNSQLTLASRSSPQPHRVNSPLSNATNISVHDQNAELYRPVSISERPGTSSGTGYGIPSPPRSMPGGKDRFYATVARQNLHGTNQVQIAQEFHAKPADSSIGNNSEITVAKRRQQHSKESSSELRSIHLGDMNISKALALASPPTSSRSVSQNTSADEDRQVNMNSIRSLSGQYHDCIGQRVTNTPSLGRHAWNLDIPHKRDASSFYSPKSSMTSTGIPRKSQFPDLTGNANSPLGSERRFSSTENTQVPTGIIANAIQQSTNKNTLIEPSTAGNQDEAQSDALKSKFVEEFGINRPVTFTRSPSTGSIDPNEYLPPRKVSVGWMSGGRRVGYGYTLVAEDNERDKEALADTKPRSGDESDKEATREKETDNKPQDSNEQSTGQDEKVSSISAEPLGSNNERLSFSNRLTLRRWSGATALVRAARTNGSTDRHSVASSFWERLTGRQNDQEDLEKKTDNKDYEDHCPGPDLHLLPEKSPEGPVSAENKNRRSLDRSMGTRLSINLAADKRKSVEEDVPAQAGPDVNDLGSLSNKRGMVKFRVLHRRRRRNNHSSTDSQSIFPVKRSLWMHDSEQMSREKLERASCPEIYDKVVAPGPGRFRLKHSRRFGPDGVEDDWSNPDQECLEMHSDPE